VHESGSIDCLPEELQQRLAQIRGRLTSAGSVDATTSQMSDFEAMKCADLLTEIALDVIILAAKMAGPHV
jgi:hypothetical protein